MMGALPKARYARNFLRTDAKGLFDNAIVAIPPLYGDQFCVRQRTDRL
jgi:hypothetical protein